MCGHTIEVPTGFDAKDAEVLDVQSVNIPGADHPHSIIVLREEFSPESVDAMDSANETARALLSLLGDTDEAERISALVERGERMADQGFGYPVVGFCEPGGAELFDMFESLTEALDAAAQIKFAGENPNPVQA